MSSGFYYVSGIMYINLGCEVMFVLANRMNAQNVDMKTVGQKILCEVSLMMFKPAFIENLMKPQAPFTIPTFYEIFNKVVNCSLMKLEKTSMEKLFYLVLMTFKRQIFLLSSPLELFTLTLTHLQDVVDLHKNNKQASSCIKECLEIFKREGEKLTYLHYLDLKEQILSMFESYRSKIVLFCEIGSQDQNGCMIFAPRHSHNRKNVGMAQNHPSIDFPTPKEWTGTKNLQYQGYKSWKTTLGKNDYDNIRGSSKILETKVKQNKGLFQEDKEISEILGIKKMKLDNFSIDIFGSQSAESTKEMDTRQNVKVVQTKQQDEIRKKIDKQFGDLDLGKEKEGGEDEIDLLELMDS